MADDEGDSPRVLISYSHDSEAHKGRVRALADRLCSEGIDTELDQYVESPAEGWPRWMEKQIREADFVLMVCTETYCRHVVGQEISGQGRGTVWEACMIYQTIYNAGAKNSKFIPVLPEPGDPNHIPTPLQSVTFYRPFTEEGYKLLYRRLTGQHRTPKPPLGRLRSLPQVLRPAHPEADDLDRRLRHFYLITHDNISPELAAGLTPLPRDWVEQQVASFMTRTKRIEYEILKLVGRSTDDLGYPATVGSLWNALRVQVPDCQNDDITDALMRLEGGTAGRKFVELVKYEWIPGNMTFSRSPRSFRGPSDRDAFFHGADGHGNDFRIRKTAYSESRIEELIHEVRLLNN